MLRSHSPHCLIAHGDKEYFAVYYPGCRPRIGKRFLVPPATKWVSFLLDHRMGMNVVVECLSTDKRPVSITLHLEIEVDAPLPGPPSPLAENADVDQVLDLQVTDPLVRYAYFLRDCPTISLSEKAGKSAASIRKLSQEIQENFAKEHAWSVSAQIVHGFCAKRSSSEFENLEATLAAFLRWLIDEALRPQGLRVFDAILERLRAADLWLWLGCEHRDSVPHGGYCEIVLADGSIRRVTYDSAYSDLYWALRGGGNNIGIVTRFDLATYPQGKLWAGSLTYIYRTETAAAINNAFYYLAINASQDPYAQVIIAYAYAQSAGLWVIASDLQYGKPAPNPAILQNFTADSGAVSDTLRITNLTGLTVKFNNTNPGGYRQTYWTLAVGNSASLMADIIAIFMEEVRPIQDAAGITPSVVFQPITTDMTLHFSKAGGNPLGLTSQGPLNLINFDISWTNSADDARILAAVQSAVNRSAAAAKAAGLFHPYLYQNYAALQQDVFPSYGAANLAKLKVVHEKYDPRNVWQTLQPGYFKLG